MSQKMPFFNRLLGVLGIGGGEVLFLFILAPLCLAVFAFWIWMLISAIQNNGLNGTEKVVWVLAIIFLHFLGALLYFLIGHPKRLIKQL